MPRVLAATEHTPRSRLRPLAPACALGDAPSTNRQGRSIAERLWAGADVVWSGRRRAVDGIELVPGDRALVTDPGKHGPTSFSGHASSPPERQRGVEIQLSSGERLRVRAHGLTLVAPDHPLRPEPSAAHADWWLEQLEPWPAVAMLVPRSLAGVARVLHPYVGPDGRLVQWSEAVQRSGLADERALAAATVDAMFYQGPEPDIGDLHVPGNGQLDPRDGAVTR